MGIGQHNLSIRAIKIKIQTNHMKRLTMKMTSTMDRGTQQSAQHLHEQQGQQSDPINYYCPTVVYTQITTNDYSSVWPVCKRPIEAFVRKVTN